MNGWARVQNIDKSVIKKDLTLNGVELFLESPKGLCVPRGYRDFSFVSFSEDMMGEAMKTLSPISLRDYQVPAVECVIENLNPAPKGAILFAPCGKGKTVMGLEIARRLGRKTLVLVHKEFLVEQWLERANTFLPEAKVGFWQRDTVPQGDEDIVIGMVQSICNPRREYDPKIYECFGTLIADETHRYAAPMWQEAISKFNSAFRVGLTATPERKDGMQKALFLHIGPIVYEMEGHKRVPTIWRINTDIKIKVPHLYNGEVNTSKMITDLSKVRERTDLVIRMTLRALKKGRKILILSERVSHVKEMKDLLEKELTDTDFSTSLYIGGMSQEKRQKSAESDVIVGTYAMAQEGLDIPELDTLILSTPKTSITQSVGRILRDAPNKKDPVVLDIVDKNINILNAYWGARKKKYDNLGYKILY